MDTEDINALIDRFSSMNDAQLQAVLESPEEYPPEELNAAKMVLEHRSRQDTQPEVTQPEVAQPVGAQQKVVQQDRLRRVVITDIDIPFIRLVDLVAKFVLANVLAFIVLWLIGAVLYKIYEGITYRV